MEVNEKEKGGLRKNLSLRPLAVAKKWAGVYYAHGQVTSRTVYIWMIVQGGMYNGLRVVARNDKGR